MKITHIIYLIFVAILFDSCNEQIDPPNYNNRITITTGDASNINYSSASINGILSETFNNDISDYGHCWNTTSNSVISDEHSSFGSTNSGLEFSTNIENLTPNTDYFVRAYFIIEEDVVYGNEIKFSTMPPDVPTIETLGISDTSYTTAICQSNVLDEGGSVVTQKGICYSTNANPTVTNSDTTIDGDGIGSFTSGLSNLIAGTMYYVRSYAINVSGVAYGNELLFNTRQLSKPNVQTLEARMISSTVAECDCIITDDGGSEVTERGVCSDTSQIPTYTTSRVVLSGSGTGSYTTTLVGLSENSYYYIRAYAINDVDTAYGNVILFYTTIEN